MAASTTGHASAAASASELPVTKLSRMHECFGGDSSVHDNRPMRQAARSGGTISALSVQLPALKKLVPFLERPAARAFDLGFGSGVMVGMMLAVASEEAHVVAVDLEDKLQVATQNLLGQHGPNTANCPFVPFAKERFNLLGGDAFERLAAWEHKGETFDVVYSGCSMDPGTDQLRWFLGRLGPTGAAVFNLGLPGRQGMYYVADEGKICEQLMHVNFMMCESSQTPGVKGLSVPLTPRELGAWIRTNVYTSNFSEL